MKISIDDIEIIETPIKKEKPSDTGIEDYMLDKEQVIIKSKLDKIRRICYVPKGTRPDIKKFLGKIFLFSEDERRSPRLVSRRFLRYNENDLKSGRRAKRDGAGKYL